MSEKGKDIKDPVSLSAIESDIVRWFQTVMDSVSKKVSPAVTQELDEHRKALNDIFTARKGG